MAHSPQTDGHAAMEGADPAEEPDNHLAAGQAAAAFSPDFGFGGASTMQAADASPEMAHMAEGAMAVDMEHGDGRIGGGSDGKVGLHAGCAAANGAAARGNFPAPMIGVEESAAAQRNSKDPAAGNRNAEDVRFGTRTSSLDQIMGLGGGEDGSSDDEQPLALRTAANGNASGAQPDSQQPDSPAMGLVMLPNSPSNSGSPKEDRQQRMVPMATPADASSRGATTAAGLLRLPLGRSTSDDFASPTAAPSPSASSPKVFVLPKMKRCVFTCASHLEDVYMRPWLFWTCCK